MKRLGNITLGLWLFVVLLPHASLAATITVNTTGLVNQANVGSLIVTGAASGLPETTATNFNFTSATITTNITPSTNAALVVDMVGSGNAGSFTPAGAQTKHWEVGFGSATGAMSSKTLAVAALTSMMHTHSTTSNRNAHALVALTPDVPGVAIVVDSARRFVGFNTTQVLWNHPNIASAETAKLIVGVGIEDANCNADATVTSVTYGNLSLTRIAAIQTAADFCQRVELWSVDIPHLVLSVRANSTLGGIAFEDEAVEYDAADDVGTLFVDDIVFSANEQIDALHVLANGNVAISTRNTAVVDGNTIDRADVVEITTSGTFVQTLFNGDSLFSNNNENIDAVSVSSSGNLVMSTVGSANLAGTGVRDEDIFEFDPIGPTVTIIVDGSVRITGNSDVDAVHVLDDDNLLLSTQANETVAGVAFRDGDVIFFDRGTNTDSLYMTEFVYTGNDDTEAISLAVNAGVVLDHFDITFAAAASTWVPSEIIIEAKDAGGTTLTTYIGTVTLSTSTGNGDWTAPNTTSDPALGTLTPGAADSGGATYTFVAGDGGDIAIVLADEHAETLTITVNDAAAVVSSVSGNITFSDNAFLITPTTSGGDNVVAGRDHVFHIQMERRDISLIPPECAVASGYNNVAQTLKAWIDRDVDDPTGVLPTLAEQTAALGDGLPPGADNLQLDFSVLW